MRSKPCFSLDRASADTPTLLGEGSFRYVLRADLQARLLLRRLAFFSAPKSRPRERPFCLVQLREPFLAQQPPPTRGLPSAADAKTSPGRPCPLPNYILALSCTNTAHEHIFFGIFHRLSTSQAPPAFTSATTTQSTASTALRPALLSRRALGCGSHASSRASLLFLFICLPLTSGLVVRYNGCPTTPTNMRTGERCEQQARGSHQCPPHGDREFRS